MADWLWALALKPFAAVAWFVVLFGGARAIAWLIYWLLPKGRLKTWLFRVDDSGDNPPPPPILPRWTKRLR